MYYKKCPGSYFSCFRNKKERWDTHVQPPSHGCNHYLVWLKESTSWITYFSFLLLINHQSLLYLASSRLSYQYTRLNLLGSSCSLQTVSRTTAHHGLSVAPGHNATRSTVFQVVFQLQLRPWLPCILLRDGSTSSNSPLPTSNNLCIPSPRALREGFTTTSV